MELDHWSSNGSRRVTFYTRADNSIDDDDSTCAQAEISDDRDVIFGTHEKVIDEHVSRDFILEFSARGPPMHTPEALEPLAGMPSANSQARPAKLPLRMFMLSSSPALLRMLVDHVHPGQA